MKCPSCNFEGSVAEFGDPLRCPDCGAYYEKALLFQQKQEQARQAAEKATPAAPSSVAAGRKQSSAGHLYCTSCGARSYGKSLTKGSIFIELVLWLCFLLPGLIYSIWRLSSRQQVCTVCEAPGLIPINSPKARRELGLE